VHPLVSLVRDSGLNLYPPGDDVHKSDRTVKSAVRRMKNLHGLEVYSNSLFRLFFDSQFPSLSHCGIPYSREIIALLKQHLGYTFFLGTKTNQGKRRKSTTSTSKTSPFEFMSLIQPIHMPRLGQFTGRTVVSGSPTCNITLIEETIISLLINVVCVLDNRLVFAIMKYMHQITVMEDIEDEEKEDALLHLPMLLTLSMQPHASEADIGLDAEFEALCGATFLSNTCWVRFSNVWVPYSLDSPTNTPNLNYKWFFKKVITTLALLLIYASYGMFVVKSTIEKTGIVVI
ncbi:hypothetical protein DFH07DRAFT_1006968, partial [Mycena maculata]